MKALLAFSNSNISSVRHWAGFLILVVIICPADENRRSTGALDSSQLLNLMNTYFTNGNLLRLVIWFVSQIHEVQSNQKSNPKFVTVTTQNVTNYSNRITKIEK